MGVERTGDQWSHCGQLCVVEVPTFQVSDCSMLCRVETVDGLQAGRGGLHTLQVHADLFSSTLNTAHVRIASM